LELRDTILVLQPGPRASFIFLFRKPLKENTVVEQVASTGTGGINVEACRIGTTKEVPAGVSRTTGHSFNASQDGSFRRETGQEGGHDPNLGRWPPNVVLVHAPGCQSAGTKRVRNIGGTTRNTALGVMNDDGWTPTSQKIHRSRDEGGMETITAWSCAPGCPVPLLDGQSAAMGMHSAGNKRPMNHEIGNRVYEGGWKPISNNPDYYKDAGGASRFYPQLQGEDDLADWIEKLVSSPPV
jgi:general stress protein YciG